MRRELLSGMAPAERGSIADVPIERVTKEQFRALNRGQPGEAMVRVHEGQATLIVAEGAPASALHDQIPKLKETVAPGTGGRVKNPNEALPPRLRNRVAIEVDTTGELKGNTVQVHPTYGEGGHIAGIEMRIGPNASAADIQAHIGVVDAMRDYSGLLGRVRVTLDAVKLRLGMDVTTPLRPAQFEAQLELGKLEPIIDGKLKQLADAPTPEAAASLEADIAHQRGQVEHFRSVILSGVEGPGRGFVAATARTKARRGKAGAPEGPAAEPGAEPAAKPRRRTGKPGAPEGPAEPEAKPAAAEPKAAPAEPKTAPVEPTAATEQAKAEPKPVPIEEYLRQKQELQKLQAEREALQKRREGLSWDITAAKNDFEEKFAAAAERSPELRAFGEFEFDNPAAVERMRQVMESRKLRFGDRPDELRNAFEKVFRSEEARARGVPLTDVEIAKAEARIAEATQAIAEIEKHPRYYNDVLVSEKLPDPVAGWEYKPNVLTGGTDANAQSHINGFRSELRLANRVAEQFKETVIKYGDATGTHGSDIISVRANGEVVLWDSKFHSDSSVVERSDTFDGARLENAFDEAKAAIRNAKNLTPEQKNVALDNLDKGNFTAITSSTDQTGRWIDKPLVFKGYKKASGSP